MSFRKRISVGSKVLHDKRKSVDEKLEKWSKAHNGFGVEAFRDYTGKFFDRYYGSTVLLYVNVGDSYDETLAYCVVNDRFYIGNIDELFNKIPRKVSKALCGN